MGVWNREEIRAGLLCGTETIVYSYSLEKDAKAMKIISITKGQYEEIKTDEIEYLNRYRRIDQMKWERWMGDTHQWIIMRFCDQIEKSYQSYIKEYGERNPNNITNAW